jgi:CO dehydrogenase/acetyl-CoA synthase beta subunit
MKSGGAPIKEDSVVAGTTKYAVLSDQFSTKLRDNLERFQSELNDFIEGFTNLSESEQMRRLEKELDRLLAELQHFGEAMKHELKTEILPRLKEKIEELRRRLRELGREDDLKQIDRKMERLTVQLRT